MKLYVKSAKQFYGEDNEVVSLERETRSLTYTGSSDGDYYNGLYHISVRFEDTDGNSCYIDKIDDGLIDSNNPYGLVEGNRYTVSGYFVPRSLGSGFRYFFIKNPRISGIKGADGKEVVLKFTYPSHAIEDATRLCEVLDNNNIEYKCYGPDADGYPIQFNILRSGKTWNEIMRLVNSVRAARYKQEKMIVDRSEGMLRFKDF